VLQQLNRLSNHGNVARRSIMRSLLRRRIAMDQAATDDPTVASNSTPLLVDEESVTGPSETANVPLWKRFFADDCFGVTTGLGIVSVTGSLLGVVLPKDSSLSGIYAYASNMLGYIAFAAWSLSFYPQVAENYQRRSTAGLSTDFCVLNMIGFACYAVFNVGSWYIDQDAVQSNDIAFAVHAFVLSAITVGQIVYYEGWSAFAESRGRGAWAWFLYYRFQILLLAVILLATVVPLGMRTLFLTTWLPDYLKALSMVKVGITLSKYTPQVVSNVRRRSTQGFSIWQILLDFTGGICNNLQYVGDSKALHLSLGRNPAKLALGSVSMFFDVIFMVQHYVLYRSTSDTVATDDQEAFVTPDTTDDV